MVKMASSHCQWGSPAGLGDFTWRISPNSPTNEATEKGKTSTSQRGNKSQAIGGLLREDKHSRPKMEILRSSSDRPNNQAEAEHLAVPNDRSDCALLGMS